MDREEILETLRASKRALQAEFPLQRLALFGSYARATPAPDSDVDILVEVEPSIGLGFVTLPSDSKISWAGAWTWSRAARSSLRFGRGLSPT